MSIDRAYDEVRRVVGSAGAFGDRVADTGAELYGHVPHVAPEAWFHALYPPLDDDGLVRLESSLGRALPEDYAAWLRRSNGADLFSGALSLFGLRSDYARGGDSAWQPFDLVSPNTQGRPRGLDDDAFVFGSYEWDGSLLALTADGRVVRVDRDDGETLTEWDDLATMLVQELQRLAALYDEAGRERDADAPTTP